MGKEASDNIRNGIGWYAKVQKAEAAIESAQHKITGHEEAIRRAKIDIKAAYDNMGAYLEFEQKKQSN